VPPAACRRSCRLALSSSCRILQAKLEPEQRTALIERGKKIKEDLEGLDARLEALEAELQREGQRLPNMTHPGAEGRS
jgi:seryl-tRNA synthetase